MKKQKRVKVYRRDYLNTFVLGAVVAQLEALGYFVKII